MMRKILLAITAIIVACNSADAQLFASFKKLSRAEKKFAIWHPIAAYRAYPVMRTAAAEAQRRLADPDLDGDGNGGMVDAFRHTLWMALTSQKIGERKAVKLGRAHEAGNYEDFIANRLEDGDLPDSAMCMMDLLNNDVGAALGRQYKKKNYAEMVEIVKQNVLDGKLWKVWKDEKRNCLDSDGKIIDLSKYRGSWNIPKVLVESNRSGFGG